MLDTVTPGKFPAASGHDPLGKFITDSFGMSQGQLVAEIRPKLHRLDNEALIELRGLLDDVIEDRAAERRRQLAAIKAVRGTKPTRGKASALRGRKVPPKYRGPNGETWAGRGAYPKWLAALLGEGRKIDEFRVRES